MEGSDSAQLSNSPSTKSGHCSDEDDEDFNFIKHELLLFQNFFFCLETTDKIWQDFFLSLVLSNFINKSDNDSRDIAAG